MAQMEIKDGKLVKVNIGGTNMRTPKKTTVVEEEIDMEEIVTATPKVQPIVVQEIEVTESNEVTESKEEVTESKEEVVTTSITGGTNMNTPKVGKKVINHVKKNLAVINYTVDSYKTVTPEVLAEVLSPRISLLNAKKVLADIIGNGTISITDPEVLADWTYKAVHVEGTVYGDDVSGKKIPEIVLTSAQFSEVTPEQVAGYIKEHTTEKRAGEIINALIAGGCYIPTATEIVRLSNGRILVEGVSIAKANKDTHKVLVRGIKVNIGNGDKAV
jgi:hypothetical protein